MHTSWLSYSRDGGFDFLNIGQICLHKGDFLPDVKFLVNVEYGALWTA